MSDAVLTRILRRIASVHGVRGVLIATFDGALANGEHSGMETRLAHDVAKTIRRMVVASSTVGAPVEEMIVTFGPARLLVVPLRENATLAVFVDGPVVIAAVRPLLRVEVERLREVVVSPSASMTTMSRAAISTDEEADDDLERLLQTPLGPFVRRIEASYVRHATAGRCHATPSVSVATVRDQIREWMHYCTPSSYTLPLLLDGLSRTLDGNPRVRAAFAAEMEGVVKGSQRGTIG